MVSIMYLTSSSLLWMHFLVVLSGIGWSTTSLHASIHATLYTVLPFTPGLTTESLAFKAGMKY